MPGCYDSLLKMLLYLFKDRHFIDSWASVISFLKSEPWETLRRIICYLSRTSYGQSRNSCFRWRPWKMNQVSCYDSRAQCLITRRKHFQEWTVSTKKLPKDSFIKISLLMSTAVMRSLRIATQQDLYLNNIKRDKRSIVKLTYMLMWSECSTLVLT